MGSKNQRHACGKKTILIVDDEADIRRTVAEIVEIAGYEAVCAESGAKAWELLAQRRPDIIICDVSMPGMDGWEFMGAVRGSDRFADIPVIFLSGLTEKATVRKGMNLGAEDYLTKPFQEEELLSSIEARLRDKQSERKRTEQKLDELRQSMSKSIPHELLTPLNGILGFSELLHENAAQLRPAEVQEMAGSIHESGQRILRLVNKFIAYSELELAASDPFKMTAMREALCLDVQPEIDKAAKDAARELGRGADLQTDCCRARAKIDCRRLYQAVFELAGNAFIYSASGQKVRIIGRMQDGMYQIEVHDSGRGMTSEQVASLGAYIQFDRAFYEQQGTGLGFAVAKRTFEAHGGSLQITSEKGKGTLVKAAFPIAE